ncbi:hypothetical protein GGX14DRAFT_617617 [Mycena pura]|uniref:Uncharacterized protein n=1 Tax=Mycena pura TaxID=153505 RepID=A0AAD6VIC1_9AGAR|nr:hypothetical protein GGX14DRAFT_617617 [Mycena pura]
MYNPLRLTSPSFPGCRPRFSELLVRFAHSRSRVQGPFGDSAIQRFGGLQPPPNNLRNLLPSCVGPSGPAPEPFGIPQASGKSPNPPEYWWHCQQLLEPGLRVPDPRSQCLDLPLAVPEASQHLQAPRSRGTLAFRGFGTSALQSFGDSELWCFRALAFQRFTASAVQLGVLLLCSSLQSQKPQCFAISKLQSFGASELCDTWAWGFLTSFSKIPLCPATLCEMSRVALTLPSQSSSLARNGVSAKAELKFHVWMPIGQHSPLPLFSGT